MAIFLEQKMLLIDNDLFPTALPVRVMNQKNSHHLPTLSRLEILHN